MAQVPSPVELVGRVPDERLLAQDMENLPAAVGRPEPIPPSRTRGRLVAVGATLTGVTLLAGLALIGAGMVELLSGGLSLLAVAGLALGLAFVGTHWGWVHVAEATADAMQARRERELLARRREWLGALAPYTRYEVTTSVGEDGSISIVRARHGPIASGKNEFSFVREIDGTEIHSGEEPGALVAERAELLRRQAALDTECERERFEIAAGAYEAALLGRGDEEQRRAARRAASEALSEQINSNLRHPPLIE
ncbi:MAG: hypothetical protein ACR2OB_06390 [Solirubrobacteraceae bacterium]